MSSGLEIKASRGRESEREKELTLSLPRNSENHFSKFRVLIP